MNNIFTKKARRVAATVALGLALVGTLSACYWATGPMRHETAIRLASAAHMLERHVDSNGYDVTVFERAVARGKPGRVYIAGDGPLWLDGEQQLYQPLHSNNPTPVNPVALHLATHDNWENKFYIARPCQYQGGDRPDKDRGCENRLWREDRYSPEVIDTINNVLNDIKRRYNIPAFELVGFEGGGVIALALTLHRDDIANVRTVATPLDHSLLMDVYPIAPFHGSVNAAEFAARLTDVPQHHFVGHLEEEIPYKQMFDNYAAAAGNTQCMQFSIIRRASDDKGFVRIWPDLLKFPVDCKNP